MEQQKTLVWCRICLVDVDSLVPTGAMEGMAQHLQRRQKIATACDRGSCIDISRMAATRTHRRPTSHHRRISYAIPFGRQNHAQNLCEIASPAVSLCVISALCLQKSGNATNSCKRNQSWSVSRYDTDCVAYRLDNDTFAYNS